ncbi:antitoxin [Sulfolobus sp. A20]|uniref:type II toxin-antitoxin system VapB family antitoxin n=1 Tax=Sulfolobaceae TaxID=118883 RepID=UPI000846184B|nr:MULTISPECIES: antitoxin [unclassified Sulfolobus]TRM75365.1 antitoxin [Sulfolobus sp. E5]TRM76079.1 antitoxin [Sulfolobus sp. A20-N-F8]TRM79430.1 antitoxin [Sulfolobus sp. B5]TRM81256.1 antitoxin [Sulfolobus sp. D5]TRM83707.1 antitoxin [Sulfolobus sp. F3]TRM88554.1 antitoxin [Sulfolobus sp. C3]TRM89121.1 antitoxin [Sulfolobus sp. E3]TRM94813.1 antitoxin [Sulfolobus sp. A20-N-G8]TRN00050.1 antitoxin [Sulfolobus sp. F1]TRN03161.1 antitoxin [Sulfolobus sp. E1]
MFTVKVNLMSEVISIRVSRKLKKDLEELNINYSELVRQYLERVVREEKMKRLLQNADKIREELSNKSFIPSYELVRQDRDEDSR